MRRFQSAMRGSPAGNMLAVLTASSPSAVARFMRAVMSPSTSVGRFTTTGPSLPSS